MSDVARQRWFQFLGADKDARVRLFGIPYAGGGASIFRPWAELLPAPVQLCPVQLPGREWRIKETPATRMDDLVGALAEAVDPYTDLPFGLFGHSLGALVAFELARRLESEGKPPVHLFVSGHRAPQIPTSDRKLHQVPDSLFLMELRRLQGTPEEVLQNPELMRLIAPVLRADFEMAETYEFKEGPI
ncbi:MAG TPA: alpha/beta fold hydrolase, partial [Actinomycetota bacterium]|nr:alpha/beta fold hydrolase [Actinomycetota bacterium]